MLSDPMNGAILRWSDLGEQLVDLILILQQEMCGVVFFSLFFWKCDWAVTYKCQLVERRNETFQVCPLLIPRLVQFVCMIVSHCSHGGFFLISVKSTIDYILRALHSLFITVWRRTSACLLMSRIDSNFKCQKLALAICLSAFLRG